MSNEFCMTISIPTDDEGYLLLQCEYCGTFFKATPSDIEDDSVLHIFCPSCGLSSEDYFTQDVIELAMRIIENKATDMVYDTFKNLECHNKQNGMIKFKAEKPPKHKTEDPIRSGIEALEIATFPCCSRTAKIKPLLKMTGAYCPFCGVKNYEVE